VEQHPPTAVEASVDPFW